MEQYELSTSLCKKDPIKQMFLSLEYPGLTFQRPIGEAEKLAGVLAQLPSDLLGAEGEALVMLESRAQNARFLEQWSLVVDIYLQFLDIVHMKHEENTLPPDVWVFLNLFAAIPLTDVYHFKLEKPGIALCIITKIETFCTTKKNRAKLSPALESAFISRGMSCSFEMDRERFGSSPEKHAEYLMEKFIIPWTNSERDPPKLTDMDGAPDSMDTKLWPWVYLMLTCGSLLLMWHKHELSSRAAIHWVQLCKTLQKKFKEYCPRIGNPLELKGIELKRARDFLIMESHTSCYEAVCYVEMGKVRKAIDIFLDMKKKVNEWVDVLDTRAASMLLGINTNLLSAYSSIESGHEGHFSAANVEQQKSSLVEEILALSDLIKDDNMRDEDLPIRMLKAKAIWSHGLVTQKERADMFEACLREVRSRLRDTTKLPRATYVHHAMDCLFYLGHIMLQKIEPGQNELTQKLRACQYFEEALELEYEAPDLAFVTHALAALVYACMRVFLLKWVSLTPGFVLNRDSGGLEQFPGSWLTSEKGPLANVTRNAYHPIELQLVEKLASLQIAKQAQILYAANDLSDEWSHQMNEGRFTEVYMTQQLACEFMITGLVLSGDHWVKEDRFNYREQIMELFDREQIVELFDRRGYSEQEKWDRLILIDELLKRQLLSSERGRTRTLVYQLGPGYLSPETKHALKLFDSDDHLAWDAIQNGQLACGKRTVCVEYSYADVFKAADPGGNVVHHILAYVVFRGAEECQIGITHILDIIPNGLESFLDDLHSIMSGIDLKNSKTEKQDEASSTENEYNEAGIIARLEILHELLIQPIAKFLPQCPEQNVIFVPQGVVANVPFALLRNPETKQFLFERHTISLAPSLRVMGFCKQRYLYLKNLQLVDDTTPILLVGNPAYSDESHRLPGSEAEMNAIADVFQQKPGQCVGILKGFDASANAVLDVAENASKKNRTLACIHFAVHGHVTKDYPKGALELTDLPSSTSRTFGAEGESISADHKYSPWKKDDHGKEKVYEGMMVGEMGALALSSDGASSSGSKDLFDVGGSSTSAASYDSTTSSRRARSGGNTSTKTHETNVFGEVGGIRKNRTGDSMQGGKFLRSEDIIKRGIDWRAYFIVLSACNTSRGQVISEGVLNLPRAFMAAGVPCVVMSQWETDDKYSSLFMEEFYTHMRKGEYVASALRKAMLTMMRTGTEIYKWGPFAAWGFPSVCLPPQLVD